MSNSARARLADGLTLARAALTVPLGVAAAAGWWRAVAVLLVAAWWSDFFDGRMARQASTPTRLGDRDMVVDTLVGLAAATGLLVGGRIPAWVGAPVALFSIAYAVRRNPAWSMVVQGIGYGASLWQLGRHDEGGLLVTAVTILAIAVLDRSRLFGFVLPAFFNGILGRHGHHH